MNDCPRCRKAPKKNGDSYCLVCRRNYDRNYYHGNKSHILPKKHTRQKGHRKQIREYLNTKKNVACYDCKDWHPSWAMEFHHLRNKHYDISNMVSHGHSMKNVKIEVAKCIVLCVLCHRYRTFGKRRCKTGV